MNALSKKYLREHLKDWKKTSEILAELKSEKGIEISDRTWRKYVNNYNNNYEEQETFIASSNKGYKFTAKHKEIRKSAVKDFRLGISLIKNAKKHLQELDNKDQLTFFKDELLDLEQTLAELKL